MPPDFIVSRWREHYDEMCSECRIVRPNPPPAERLLYLHAVRYAGEGWAYEAPMPGWAKEDWRYPAESADIE